MIVVTWVSFLIMIVVDVLAVVSIMDVVAGATVLIAIVGSIPAAVLVVAGGSRVAALGDEKVQG